MIEVEKNILNTFEDELLNADTRLKLKELAMQANILQNNDGLSPELKATLFFLQQRINQKLIALEDI